MVIWLKKLSMAFIELTHGFKFNTSRSTSTIHASSSNSVRLCSLHATRHITIGTIIQPEGYPPLLTYISSIITPQSALSGTPKWVTAKRETTKWYMASTKLLPLTMLWAIVLLATFSSIQVFFLLTFSETLKSFILICTNLSLFFPSIVKSWSMIQI